MPNLEKQSVKLSVFETLLLILAALLFVVVVVKEGQFSYHWVKCKSQVAQVGHTSDKNTQRKNANGNP